MKFDTVIILLIVCTIGFLFYISLGYDQKGSFAETIQISIGLKERDNSPSPETTLVAPFADASVKPILDQKDRDNISLPVNKIPLDKPHRSTRHVAEWLTQHVGNALILDKQKVSQLNKEIGPSFTPEAFNQYKEFGKRTNIFSAVFHEEETKLESYLKEDPLAFSAGTENGVYQWQYEIFMVLNLVKGKLKQYKNTQSEQQLKEVYFCITATRDNDANTDGLLISFWKTGRCK